MVVTGNLELWAGHECTALRVGERYVDQTVRTGHARRPDDLERFAALGIRSLRYPILWQHVSAAHPDERDWSFTDTSLARLHALDVNVIAGLVHHGGGPRYTSLLDPAFAKGLARHAGAAARRYPWIRDWCPVNEPLTTARFSALYGHWHPHERSDGAFLRALLNEIDAIRLSMRAIRQAIPEARLVQTEDLGRTFSTAELAYQARFDNDRRWLTWDLLAGRVDRSHPLHAFFAEHGLADRLAALADDPCPADVLGINHYLTSDRFLDARLERYPMRSWGGNAHQRYADVEATRVLTPEVSGFAGVIDEAWVRYGRPLALTEVHNGSTREEQMRWLVEAWTTAQDARARGVPVLAVTAWSLLGSYDWDSLLVEDAGHYERGVFELVDGEPRDTAMVPLLQALAKGSTIHPVAAERGWWHRSSRLHYAPSSGGPETVPHPPRTAGRLLLVGADEETRAVARDCRARGIGYSRRRNVEDLRGAWGVIAVGANDSLERECLQRTIPYLAIRGGLDAAGALDRMIEAPVAATELDP